MKLDKLHVIYSLLLAHCFSLAPEDEAAILKHWKCSPYGDGPEVEWPNYSLSLLRELLPRRDMTIPQVQQWVKENPDLTRGFGKPFREPAPMKICSMPSRLEQLIAATDLAELFDLDGVPGFYRDDALLPGPASALRREMSADFSPWRINLPTMLQSGLLVPYDNGSGYTIGIRIYKSVRDRKPFLLTSRGMPGGASAIACQEAAA